MVTRDRLQISFGYLSCYESILPVKHSVILNLYRNYSSELTNADTVTAHTRELTER